MQGTSHGWHLCTTGGPPFSTTHKLHQYREPAMGGTSTLHTNYTCPSRQGTSPGRLPLISMHNVRNLVGWGGGGLCLVCRLTSCNLQLIFFLFSDDVPVENLKVCFMCKKIANKKWRKNSGVLYEASYVLCTMHFISLVTSSAMNDMRLNQDFYTLISDSREGVLPRGMYTPMWIEWQTGVKKHYLSATSFADGKKWRVMFLLNTGVKVM